jgi:hypothetical protein
MNQLHGIELRYVLTMQLSQNGPASIVELIGALGRLNFCVRGTAHATEYRIINRVRALRESAKLSL